MEKTDLFKILFGILFVGSCSGSTVSESSSSLKPIAAENSNVVFAHNAGLKVGSYVPGYTAVTIGNDRITLSELLNTGPVVLFFTRSVEWCSDCRAQLLEINDIVGKLEERGFRIFAVSHDSSENQIQFLSNKNIEFEMISDPSSNLIDTFLLRDRQFTEGKAVGAPYVSIMVIDVNGRVRAKTISGSFEKRTTRELVVALTDSH